MTSASNCFLEDEILTSIDKDDFVEVHWEEDVKEQDLVCPDDPLLFGLRTKPMWPFVSDEFVFEPVLLGEMRNEGLDGERLDRPDRWEYTDQEGRR